VRVCHGRPTRSCWSGALAVSRARVPYSLDGLRCWCQVACVPGCDHALSDDEVEVSPSQPTAELVDGARYTAPTAPLLADVPLALQATRVPVRVVGYARSAWAPSCTGLRSCDFPTGTQRYLICTGARARARTHAHEHKHTHMRESTHTHSTTHRMARRTSMDAANATARPTKALSASCPEHKCTKCQGTLEPKLQPKQLPSTSNYDMRNMRRNRPQPKRLPSDAMMQISNGIRSRRGSELMQVVATFGKDAVLWLTMGAKVCADTTSS
jgi:hypothetical protein